jgi:argininosuccinate synthase
VQAKALVEIALKEKCEYLAHGATGKGNDQVRFELTAAALAPHLKIIAPWRDQEFRDLIPGRLEAIAYCKKHNIPIKATAAKPWSSDDNILHISFEAGILEDPNVAPPENMFEYSVSPQKAPNKATKINLDFKAGVPVAINGKKLSPYQLLKKLNSVAGKNGVGRIDLVESRYVGMKSRGVYETPGGTVLYAAHRDLETLTQDRGVINLKDTLMPRFAQLIYNGYWFSPEMDCLRSLLKQSEKPINGCVFLELYKGNITITGRTSPNSLYNEDLCTMEKDEGTYDQNDATGFIKLNALPLKMSALAKRGKK